MDASRGSAAPGGPRRWPAKLCTTLSALIVVLLVHDCAVTDVEREAQFTDLGDGLVLKVDGTVVDASSLPPIDVDTIAAAYLAEDGLAALGHLAADAWRENAWPWHARAGRAAD